MPCKFDPVKRDLRTGALLACATLAAALLGACAGSALPRAGNSAPPSQASAAPTVAATAQARQAAPDELTPMLAYADRVRQMPAPELSQEISRLANPATALGQFQLALALGQLRQLPELVRAQELLARVLANTDAQALHALARLLTTRYGEQRRLEDQLDRQTQQLRDVQRRLDQTNDRLEALKAIERSLTSRPAASSPAPAGQASPTKP